MKELKIDTDSLNMRKSVSTILNLLSDFIPNACRGDAEHKLLEAFHNDGVELTSKLMRKEYEAWKELSLDKLEITNIVLKEPER
jgi:hypothetical protein